MLFKKHKNNSELDREQEFQTVLDIIKGYDRAEFKRFMDGMTLAYQGYDKVRRVQTREEKETEDITEVEKKLEYLEQKNDK